ncbi:MAG: metallophosphoesterase [Verrucomicrobia bacterium]|nr:metallophosphoesterase [Verrucomicrobiota bacterium]
MRIAQISDFHFTRLSWNPFRLFSKRILGYINWLTARHNVFSEEILEPLPALLKELEVDLLLLGGDFSTTALPQEFEVAARFVKKISIPWTAIPGNHDVYTYRSYRNKIFYRYFKNKREPIEHPADFFTLAEHQIEVKRLDGTYWLISLDVARATNLYSSRGHFSEKLEERLHEVLSLIPSESSILILSHYPFFQTDVFRHTLKGGEKIEAILKKDPRIKIFLHGHTHRNTIADLQPSGFPLILDSGSCTQTDRASWNLIDLNSEGCRVENYRWKQGWKLSRTEAISWTR